MVTIDQPRVKDLFQVRQDGRRVLPSFSLAERDRRYARIRRHMQGEGLECLIAAPGEPFEPQAGSRYLTQIGGLQGAGWAVLPLDGEATAILSSEREHRMWSRHLEWPTGLRWGSPIDLLVDRLKELRVTRVGVVGLVGVHHRPDGIISYASWVRIEAALPRVSWIHASDVLDRCRVVKGPEEIAVIQRITDADEAAIQRMVEVARPYRASMQRAVEVFEHLVAWLRPGVTVGRFLAEYEWAATRRRGVAGSVVMHTCGLGSDRPRVGVGGQANSVDWVIEPGWTFTSKTHFRHTDIRVATQVGEPVTLTETGARRLGHRDLVPIVTG